MSTPSTLRAGPRTNLALLAMLVGALVTGVLGYAIGTPGTARVVTIAHGAFGLGLLLYRRPRAGRRGRGWGDAPRPPPRSAQR